MTQPEVRFDNGHVWFVLWGEGIFLVFFWIIIWGIEEFLSPTASSQENNKKGLWPTEEEEKDQKEKLRTRAVFPPLAFLCMHNSMTFWGTQHTHTHTCLPANSATKREPLLLSLLYYSLLHQPSFFWVAFIFIAGRPLFFFKDSRHKMLLGTKTSSFHFFFSFRQTFSVWWGEFGRAIWWGANQQVATEG